MACCLQQARSTLFFMGWTQNSMSSSVFEADTPFMKQACDRRAVRRATPSRRANGVLAQTGTLHAFLLGMNPGEYVILGFWGRHAFYKKACDQACNAKRSSNHCFREWTLPPLTYHVSLPLRHTRKMACG